MTTDMEDKWICPNCGTKMQKSHDTTTPIYVCPKCGCSIEGTEQNFDFDKVCPNCNQLMGDDSECSHCGYDLGSDFD